MVNKLQIEILNGVKILTCQNQKVKFLGISRYIFELRLWKNLNSSVSSGTNSNWDFGLIWICNWIRSPHYSGFWFAFRWQFWLKERGFFVGWFPNYPRQYKTSSFGQSAELSIPRSSARFRQKLRNPRTQIYMDLSCIDPQARALKYCFKQ